jgi:hypothetical protein
MVDNQNFLEQTLEVFKFLLFKKKNSLKDQRADANLHLFVHYS